MTSRTRATRSKMAANEESCGTILPRLLQAIQTNDGVLFASSAIVHREMYLGRDVIAKNSSMKYADERGYVPVEWWIMSATEAENEKRKTNEGLTSLIVEGGTVLLRDALKVAQQELMGRFTARWPLTKVLDIGGPHRAPIYSPQLLKTLSLPHAEQEVPPIPCHVHAGKVVQGHLCGHGKTEAYFFPPLDVLPYHLNLGQVKTRLGIKPDVKKESVLHNLRLFGRHDDLYSCLNVYDIHPWETWHIEEKVVHAPGPWLTFEIQRPQDDFNLLAWQLGSQLPEEKLECAKESLQLRGLENEAALLEDGVDWEVNTDRDFQDKWWKQCEVLESGPWGKRHRIFYHCFYGEGIVIYPAMSYTRKAEADGRPFAGVIWSGSGAVNSHEASATSPDRREFLATPGHDVQFVNTDKENDLLVFTVYPII